MLMYQVLCTLLLATSPLANRNDKQCKVKITRTNNNGEPLLFHKYDDYFDYIKPIFVKKHISEVKSKHGDQIIASCVTGKIKYPKNLSNESSILATCKNNNKYYIFGKQILIERIKCDKKIFPDVSNPGQNCAGRAGSILDIGYDIRLSNRTYRKTLIEVCFDRITKFTYYVEHMLMGGGVEGSINSFSRPAFSKGNQSIYDFDPNNNYKKTAQKAALYYLLQSEPQVDEIYDKTYLARGHLAPDADFLVPVTQYGTYQYINAAPQWQNFNGGTWMALEKAVRNVASRTKREYLIVTGTYGVLQLSDVNNNNVNIYLHDYDTENPKLPVPKFYWKIMYDLDDKVGIAFVGKNHYNKDKQIKWPCKDICSRAKWGTKTWKNSVICCDINDFQTTISYYNYLQDNGVVIGVVEND